jgi:hypothetical protein
MNKFADYAEIIHPVTRSQRVKDRGGVLFQRETSSSPDK